MKKKFKFYQKYDVKEYYVYDPEKFKLEGWIRSGHFLKEIPDMNGWISPNLNIKFDISQNDLTLYDSAGNRFTSLTEEKYRADHEQQRADQEKERADRAENEAALALERIAELEQLLKLNNNK